MAFKIEQVLTSTRNQLEGVRDALAAVSAYGAAGEPKSLTEAANRLEGTVLQARGECERVRRLLRHLQVEAMPDAASRLCAGGRPVAARSMMKLYELTAGMASAQADLGGFLGECLNSLEATHAAASHQARGGRLLGSA
jgi:hypothetical protein